MSENLASRLANLRTLILDDPHCRWSPAIKNQAAVLLADAIAALGRVAAPDANADTDLAQENESKVAAPTKADARDLRTFVRETLEHGVELDLFSPEQCDACIG